jgi:hypothetical protein
MTEDQEKAKILKDSLTVVDRLANLSFTDMDDMDDDDSDEIQFLISEAKKLKRNKLFNLY